MPAERGDSSKSSRVRDLGPVRLMVVVVGLAGRGVYLLI